MSDRSSPLILLSEEPARKIVVENKEKSYQIIEQENCISSVNTIYVSKKTFNEKRKPITDNLERYLNVYGPAEQLDKRPLNYKNIKGSDLNFRKENERLKSLQKLPKHLAHLVIPMAKAGFYFIGNEYPDEVKCPFCQGQLYKWKLMENPVKEHKRSFPTCPFILNLNVGNEPEIQNQKSENENSKFISVDPELKDFEGTIDYNVISSVQTYELLETELDFSSREKSFRNHDHMKNFVFYGLYVVEKDDGNYLHCVECHRETLILKGVLRLPNKVFHLSSCERISKTRNERLKRRNMKEDIEIHKDKKNRKKFCKIEFAFSETEVNLILDHKFSQLGELKVDQNKWRHLVECKLKKTGKDYETLIELINDAENFVEEFETENATHSLEFILRDYSCVTCLDNPVAVVLLPCGHLKTCEKCSNMLTNCPVCKMTVERKVSRFCIGNEQ